MLYHLFQLSSSISVLYSYNNMHYILIVFQNYLPILNSNIFLTFSNSSFIFQFPIWCHLFHSCYVHQLSNSQFSSSCLFLCFSFSPFLVFIIPFHCLRISVPSLNTRHYLQNVVFPEFFFNSSLFPIPFFTPLICYSFPGGVFFLLTFFLALGSAN